MSDRLRSVNLLGLAVPVALLVLWQVLVSAKVLELDYVPGPIEIFDGFRELIRTGELWPNLIHTFTAVSVAWLIAVIGGIALGVLVGLVGTAWNWSMASISVLRTLPAVALVPVALLIFGYSMTSEIVVAAVVAIWPVVLSTGVAIQNAGPRLRDVARTFRMSRLDTVRKMVLPAAMPYIVVAARLALSVCLILVILTEMVGNPEGLGYGLVRKQQGLQPEGMWAYLLFIGVLGLVLQSLLNGAARRAMPGFAPQLGTKG